MSRTAPGRKTESEPPFPWLGEEEFFELPDLSEAPGDEPFAVGANLSPGMLLSAYQQGAFPWFSRHPIQWWSPDPRFVIPLEEVHFSKSLLRTIKKQTFTVTCDTVFDQVIHHCATVPREGQPGTWIVRDMEKAYSELHRLGYAHSVEAWADGQLAGGLYGVAVGSTFCGESMFSLKTDASKTAFWHLVQFVRSKGLVLIDSQVHTDLFESLGARHIPRSEYLAYLKSRTQVRKGPLFGSWTRDAQELFDTLHS